MSSTNIYACLVCGRYFQGKGKNTPAYEHSLDHEHYLFLNLDSAKIFILPENEEIIDSSLEDIQYNLNPTYTTNDI